MRMSKLGYFAEFVVFPPIVIFTALLAFRGGAGQEPVIWILVFAAGLLGWTLLEYVLHRALFHHAPLLAAIHARHHAAPAELIGTPAWVSMMIGTIAVAVPAWAMLGFNLGTAATAGLVGGYLWYVFVHYAAHHWRPGRGTYLYRVRLRHARHHHRSDEGNFGVSTDLWDRVFGTVL